MKSCVMQSSLRPNVLKPLKPEDVKSSIDVAYNKRQEKKREDKLTKSTLPES